MGRRRPIVLALAALVTAAPWALAAPARAVTISTSPELTWQTVGSLDAHGRNLQGRVEAIAYGRRASSGMVFLGGDFTQVRPPRNQTGNAVARQHLAAFSVKRGRLISAWKVPVKAANGTARVVTVALSPDGKVLYVGGRFDAVDGKARSNVAAVNTSTGRLLRWHLNANGGVHAFLVGRGDGRIYLGGTFSRINGTVRQHLAAVSSKRGSLVGSWNPSLAQEAGRCPPRCAADVRALDLSRDGDTVYVGGSFARVNGTRRNSAAAVTARTGHLTHWNPSVFNGGQNGSLNIVSDIDAVGKRIFLCGDFYQVNYGRSPLVSPNLAAVDRRHGNSISAFNAATDGALNACEYHAKAKRLFIGGHFDHVGRRSAIHDNTAPTRHHFAAVSTRKGALDAWNPDANSVPGAFAVAVQKTHVAFGGDFTTINGDAQAGFAQFKLSF